MEIDTYIILLYSIPRQGCTSLTFIKQIKWSLRSQRAHYRDMGPSSGHRDIPSTSSWECYENLQCYLLFVKTTRETIPCESLAVDHCDHVLFVYISLAWARDLNARIKYLNYIGVVATGTIHIVSNEAVSSLIETYKDYRCIICNWSSYINKAKRFYPPPPQHTE